jgi:hypothetical protein
MRTFYIFKINNEYSKLVRDLPTNLYTAYLNIKLSTQNNLPLLYNEYFSFTEALSIKEIKAFIYHKMNKLDGYSIYNNIHMYNNYYTDESSKLIIKNSYMILKSNSLNSTFFSVLLNIPNIFIIDFDNKDYFWLSNFSKLRLVS